MIEELNSSIEDYLSKWDNLVANRTHKEFFLSVKPVAVGWKVADRQEYNRLYAELHDNSDRIVETWMNGRWIAKMHLKNARLPKGIQIVKLMQRRPGSNDGTGLDHVDFYGPAVNDAEEILKNEKDLKWSWEKNDVIEGYEWLSVWFDGTEAKLKAGTVIDIVIQELKELNVHIKTSN